MVDQQLTINICLGLGIDSVQLVSPPRSTIIVTLLPAILINARQDSVPCQVTLVITSISMRLILLYKVTKSESAFRQQSTSETINTCNAITQKNVHVYCKIVVVPI